MRTFTRPTRTTSAAATITRTPPGHAHDDEHEAEHGEPPAGPIDWGAWLVSIVGLAAGGVVAVVIGQVLAHG